ncbi:MAG: phage protein Gp27 family protein [Sphingomonadaceae bacterium]
MSGTETGATDSKGRRNGRGRLSSIEMLPEICDEDIAWANAALRERAMPQTEILREFNARLADRGVKPVTKSAFSRYSVRLAIEVRKLAASRQITDAVLARMEPGERSDSTIAAVELLKHRIVELVMDGEDANGKELAAAALALNRLSTIAAREKEGRRKDRKDELAEEDRDQKNKDREQAELAEEVGRIAHSAGLDETRIAAIRKGVLGLSG